MKLSAIAVGLAVWGLVCAADAAEPVPGVQDRRTAAALANVARERFDQGDFAAALPMFLEAEERAQSLVVTLYIARCYDKLGRLREAREKYRALLAAKREADEPQQFIDARKSAEAELAALLPRIPSIAIRLGPSVLAHHTVRLDGALLDRADLGPRELDPGLHRLELFEGPAAIGSQQVELPAGEKKTVTLDRNPPTGAQPARAEEVGGEAGSSGVTIAGGVISGVGGAILLGAGGASLFALLESDAVEAQCASGRCGLEEESRYDKANDAATTGTVLWIVGGVTAATGITVLAIGLSDTTSRATVELHPRGIGFTARW